MCYRRCRMVNKLWMRIRHHREGERSPCWTSCLPFFSLLYGAAVCAALGKIASVVYALRLASNTPAPALSHRLLF